MSSLQDLKLRAFVADGYTGSLQDMEMQFWTAIVNGTGLTQAEIDQLKNIGTSVLSASDWANVAVMADTLTLLEGEWEYLGAMDQGVATTDSVVFDDMSLGAAQYADIWATTNNLQLGANAGIQSTKALGAGGEMRIFQNVVVNAAAGLEAISTDEVSFLYMNSGAFSIWTGGVTTAGTAPTMSNKFEVGNTGDVSAKVGNFVVSTSGKGIADSNGDLALAFTTGGGVTPQAWVANDRQDFTLNAGNQTLISSAGNSTSWRVTIFQKDAAANMTDAIVTIDSGGSSSVTYNTQYAGAYTQTIAVSSGNIVFNHNRGSNTGFISGAIRIG